MLNIRKTRVLLFLYVLTLLFVVAYDLRQASVYRDKGICAYAWINGVETVRGRKSFSQYQSFYYGEHSRRFSVDMIGDYNPMPQDNIVPILANPNNPDDFIIGSKSDPLPVLARVYRFQDHLYILARSLVFFLFVWIVFLIVFGIIKLPYFVNSNKKQINVARWSFIGVGSIFALILASMLLRFNDNSQLKSYTPTQSVDRYRVYQIAKDSIALRYDSLNAPIVPFRVDEIKVFSKTYPQHSHSYYSPDSSLFYVAMRLKNSIAISVQATSASKGITQTASIRIVADSIPLPFFHTEVQQVYFRTPDTFRVFKNGRIVVDTVRQYLVHQPNIYTDTLMLLDAGIEDHKTMGIFASKQRFPRPSLRLEKSAIYDGENFWVNTFYKTPAKYLVIYSVDKHRFSDFSFYGTLYSAFYIRNTTDSIP